MAEKGTPMSPSEIVRNEKQHSSEMTVENISKLQEAIDQMKAMKENNCKLKQNIYHSLMQIKHDIMINIRELEEKCEANVPFLKRQNENVDTMMAQIEGKQKELQKMKVTLDEASTPVRENNAIKEADISNASANILLQTLNSEVSRNHQIHQGIKMRMETTEKKLNRIKEVLISTGEDEHELLKQLVVMTAQEGNPREIPPQILQGMSATTRCLVHLEGLYAIQQQGGIIRYGKLSLFENKLCLHHLSEIERPLNVSTVKFDDLMKLMDPSSRLTFLEFGNDENRLCKAFIRLSKPTKKAQNFALLCSGEKGVSYAGTKIHYFGENESRQNIVSGDYETNTGDGGKALVPGTGEEKGEWYPNTSEIGSIGRWSDKGDNEASQFYIVTKVKKQNTDDTIFGKVESGIDALVEATSAYLNMEDEFWITDCGAVLIENLPNVQIY